VSNPLNGSFRDPGETDSPFVRPLAPVGTEEGFGDRLSLGRGVLPRARMSGLFESLDEPIPVLLLQPHVILEEAFLVMIETLRDPVSNLSDFLDHGIRG
jgi:hypothetical protein